MILVDVEIENYKQFAGTQRFTPGPNGVVGIIGTNGAGKSTLFEAIEWCLYGPREIRSDEIPPRGDEGRRPRVRVRLQHPTTSATYEIERTLRKSGASAELVEITPDGERSVIATGTTAVTSYTASKLIGLEYRAFVATFFTRQKELSFFGGLKATDRRREVGRLLGLETIRLAQQEIAEERTAKKNHAAGLQAQYEQESGERDFDAERVVLMARQAEIDTLIAQRAAELKTAEAAYNDARNAHSLLVEQFIEAQRLAGERGRHEITLQNAQAAVAATRRELDRIAAAHAERQELSERTSAIEAIGADVMRLEMLKERADHRAQLVAERETLQRDRDRLVGQIRSALVPAYTPWTSVPEQSDTPVQWIDTLVAAAAESDSTHTETQLAAVTGVLDAQKRASDAETKLEKCRSLASDLQTRLTDLLAGGDPDRRDAELNEART
ncbi:MAG: AAA family ATPase, partial [Chloroflexota bacterium]|nr:AAA family ATPase [Chloroflexota bacterium]